MLRPLAFGLLCFAALGCAKAPPERGVLIGTIKYKGQVVPHGFVTFVSKANPALRDVCAIKADGTFAVTNAPVGPCKVIVQVNGAIDLQAYQQLGKTPPPDFLPRDIAQKYAYEQSTPLEITIEGGEKTIELEIK
jgi:hypothetical protein